MQRYYNVLPTNTNVFYSRNSDLPSYRIFCSRSVGVRRVQMSQDICTRFACYLYYTKQGWIKQLCCQKNSRISSSEKKSESTPFYYWVEPRVMMFSLVGRVLGYYKLEIELMQKRLSFFWRNLCLTLRPGCAPQDLLLLWKHECDWVYGRRLIDSVDRERFQQAFLTAAKKRFIDDEQVSKKVKIWHRGLVSYYKRKLPVLGLKTVKEYFLERNIISITSQN